jgi:hypothetical protein
MEVEYGEIDMRAEVLYFKRSVTVECRIQPFTYNDGDTDNAGSIHLENIEMVNCGTKDTNLACVKL